MDKITRRDALRMMGIGVAGLAAAGIVPTIANAQIPPQGVRPPQGGPQGGMPQMRYAEPEVYSGPDVVIRRIDEHTWEGNGHLMSNETIYIIEGSERAILLDAGTKIDDLDKIVAGITDKPVTLIATHVHPDQIGRASCRERVSVGV